MSSIPNKDPDPSDLRARILDAASKLIARGGVAAVTTRAVAAASNVQAPTLYRLFGEKRGLLDAVAEHGLATFIAQKSEAVTHPDPVEDLRNAWDDYVAFGISNPAVFAIMNDIATGDPPSPAALAGIAILQRRVERIAQAGRLSIPVKQAVALIHATGVGTVTTLLAEAETQRDLRLSTIAREAILAALVADAKPQPGDPLVSLAIGLRARINETSALSPGERLLLDELLERLATSGE